MFLLKSTPLQPQRLSPDPHCLLYSDNYPHLLTHHDVLPPCPRGRLWMITKHLRLLREGGGGVSGPSPWIWWSLWLIPAVVPFKRWSCRFSGPGLRKWPVATKTFALETQMPGSQKLNPLHAKADIQRKQVLRATALAEQPAGASSTYLTRYSNHPVSWSLSPVILPGQDWLPSLWEAVQNENTDTHDPKLWEKLLRFLPPFISPPPLLPTKLS